MDVNEIHRNRLSRLDKLAVVVTQRIGTMGFFFLILGWTLGWLGWNVLAPRELRFDPYPAFVLWLFISNLIQIHLMPLIMIGQNLQGRHAELRAEFDLQTDRRSGKEIEQIMERLNQQEKLLEQILKKLR